MRKPFIAILLAICLGLAGLFVVPAAQAAPTQNVAAAKAGYRIIAYLYSDWYYGGYRKDLVYTDYGDCDSAGYTFTDTWGGTRFRQTSSISNSAMSPRCNTARITTTYGGVVQVCIPTVYIGNAANDHVYRVNIRFTEGCRRY